MKQSISQDQWNELSNEQKVLFVTNGDCRKAVDYRELDKRKYLPSIGQMIEFLGKDAHLEIQQLLCNEWVVRSRFDLDKIAKVELVDALFLACKYKLNA